MSREAWFRQYERGYDARQERIELAKERAGSRSHDWAGPDRVNKHVHCSACGKIFEIGKSKGVCP